MNIENFFPYRVAVAAASLSRHLENVYRREHGISREEWRVLFLLADVPSLTSKELSLRSSLDKIQISRAAQRLEKKGLIEGQEAAEDRRLRDYACTDEGRAFFEEVFPKVKARADAILSSMSPADIKALEQGLSALKDATARVRTH
tara:strand:- start:652 stop:1089 length:438 start_codon:yes stop_codon:yes gene_type:complete